MDKNETYYSIGQVSKLCNISRKTLRYYEQVGLILPDKIGSNNYRYYSRDALLAVPVIRYFKQMGFKLDELKELMNDSSFGLIGHEFQGKLREHEEMEQDILRMKQFLQDWYDLILEAQIIIEEDVREISLKYLEPQELCAMDFDFDYDYKEATINLAFTNFVSDIGNAITGPVMVRFPSFGEKMAGACRRATVLQKAFLRPAPEHRAQIPGGLYLSVYHIGDHAEMNKTYERIIEWTKTNTYRLEDAAIERYVIDYWTTNNPDLYVTEILIRVHREND